MLRLRLAFGVGIGADALSYLLSWPQPAGVGEIAGAIGWNAVAVRRSLDDLAAAGFIRVLDPIGRSSSRSKRYTVDRSAWAQILGPSLISVEWGFAQERLMMMVHLLAWHKRGGTSNITTPIQVGDWGKRWLTEYRGAFRFPDDVEEVAFRGSLEAWAGHTRSQLALLDRWFRKQA